MRECAVVWECAGVGGSVLESGGVFGREGESVGDWVRVKQSCQNHMVSRISF